MGAREGAQEGAEEDSGGLVGGREGKGGREARVAVTLVMVGAAAREGVRLGSLGPEGAARAVGKAAGEVVVRKEEAVGVVEACNHST